jgi:hypothetical protein
MADRIVVGDRHVPVPARAAKLWGVNPSAVRPVRGEDAVMVATPQAWVEVPFEGVWTAAYRLAVQDGALIVAELRLFPGGADRDNAEPAGLWAGEILGTDAVAPSGGLTSRLLKRLRIGEHHRHHANVLRQRAAGASPYALGELIARMGVLPPVAAGPRRGRRPLDALFLARIARAYSRAVERGYPPVAAITKRLGLPPRRIPGWVYMARKNGYLTPAEGPGHIGGTEMPKTRLTLEGARHTKQPPKRRAKR